MQLSAGSSLQAGQYVLQQALDRQGVGLTYQATHTPTQKTVVIKLLNAALKTRPDFAKLRQRFIDRARLLARCQHPCLPKVLDFFIEEEIPCLVMDYVTGDSFAELVRAGKGLSEREAIYYIRQVGLGLEHAHQQGLLHGNLLPQHFIRRSGASLVTLVGFEALGLAHPKSPYSAPERRSGQANHPSTDLYALAAILYHLLTGHPPVLTQADPEHPEATLAEKLPLLPLLSPAVQQAIRHGLAQEIPQRPANITVWLNQLTEQTIPTPPQAKPLAPTAKAIAHPQPAPTPAAPQPVHAIATSPLPRFRTEPIPEAPISATAMPATSSPTLPEAAAQPPGELPIPSHTPSHTVPRLSPVAKVPTWVSLLPKKAMVLTTCIATAIGVSFGLALRFKAAETPGSGIFRVGQSFPERQWKGSLEPKMEGDIPVEQPRSTDPKAPPIKEEIPFFPEPQESPLPQRTRLTPKMVEQPSPELPPEEPIVPTAPPRSVEPAPEPVAPPRRNPTPPKPAPEPAPLPVAPKPAPEPAPLPAAPEPAPPPAAPEPAPPPVSNRPAATDAAPLPPQN